MKLEEIKDMLPVKPERLETVEEPKRQELVNACYDLIGCLHDVYFEEIIGYRKRNRQTIKSIIKKTQETH